MSLDVRGEVIIDTPLGKLRGRKTITYKNFPYYSFQGIPYAKPPVGNLRFKDTEPPEPWNGIHDATKEGNRSPSFTDEHAVIGDEDCLYLNVYTPKLPDTSIKKKPVMFWIHSGGFYRGSGNTDLYSPDYLMSEDVVVVTINYRLSVFGWIIVEDDSLGVPGNLGLKDMVMALKWVQNNIESFNGDPNNVTIWGQSAGAISTHSLVVSPAAKGLFHKAIIQSGTSFIGFDPNIRFMKAIPTKLVSYAGLETDSEKEAVDYLKTLTTEQIILAYIELQKYSDTKYEGICGPIIETTPSNSTIIDQHPELYYLENRANTVPMIIGSNTMDGMVYASKKNPDGAIQTDILNPEVLVPYELNIPRGSPKSLELGKKIVEFYYGKETPSRRNLDKYSKYQTDIKFNIRIKRIIKLHQNVSSNPIYLYRFGFESPYNLYKKFFGMTEIPGVCHGDELTYLFRTKYSQTFKYGSPEDITHYRMIKMWTNFAKTGNPNSMEPDPLLRTKWLPVEPGTLNHLFIGKVLVNKKEEPDSTRMKFWDEFYEKYFKENYQDINEKDQNTLQIIKQMQILKSNNNVMRSEKVM